VVDFGSDFWPRYSSSVHSNLVHKPIALSMFGEHESRVRFEIDDEIRARGALDVSLDDDILLFASISVAVVCRFIVFMKRLSIDEDLCFDLFENSHDRR